VKHPEPTAPEELSPPPRTVVYSPETTAAYGAVIDAGMTGNADDVLIALRHLMMMVHCDFTGELRQPHYYPWPGQGMRQQESERDVCVVCGNLLYPAPEPHCEGCEVGYIEGERYQGGTEEEP
jgi:hypothetical protein